MGMESLISFPFWTYLLRLPDIPVRLRNMVQATHCHNFIASEWEKTCTKASNLSPMLFHTPLNVPVAAWGVIVVVTRG